MEDIKQMLKGLQNITRCFSGFEKVDLKRPDALNELDKLIHDLPSGDVIVKSLEEWKTQIKPAIEALTSKRIAEFGRTVTEFIRAQKDVNTTVREFNNAWRIGPVELQLRPEQASAQFSYNCEVLVKWFPVSNSDYLTKQYAGVRKQLDDAALPLDKLNEVFLAAHEYLSWKRKQSNDPNPNVVPVLDFYKEVRVSMFRTALDLKQPVKEMPLWAFLYNLDRYSSASSQIPQNKRIGFQAGSQYEVSKNKGIIVNGLDAFTDYKTICHVIA